MPGDNQLSRSFLPGAAHLHWLASQGMEKGIFNFRIGSRGQPRNSSGLGRLAANNTIPPRRAHTPASTSACACCGERAQGIARHHNQAKLPASGMRADIRQKQINPGAKSGKRRHQISAKQACQVIVNTAQAVTRLGEGH